MTTRRWMIAGAVVALLLAGIVGIDRLRRRHDDFVYRAWWHSTTVAALKARRAARAWWGTWSPPTGGEASLSGDGLHPRPQGAVSSSNVSFHSFTRYGLTASEPIEGLVMRFRFSIASMMAAIVIIALSFAALRINSVFCGGRQT
jgi:hypothetical protein